MIIISPFNLAPIVEDFGDLVEVDLAGIELRALAGNLDLLWASPTCEHHAPRPMKQAKAKKTSKNRTTT